MKHRVDYDVIRRPSNTEKGRTNILNKTYEGDGKTVDTITYIGYIEKLRGASYFTAYVSEGYGHTPADEKHKLVEGEFKTRSQAGHEILRKYNSINNIS